MIAAEIYTDLTRLGDLKDRWGHLWSLTPNSIYSQTFDYYRAAAEVSDFAPCVFAVSVSGRLLGIWAMFGGRLGSRFRRRPALTRAGIGGSTAGIVGPSPTATGSIVARYLGRNGYRGSVTFTDVAADLPLVASLEANGFSCYTKPGSALMEVRFDGRWGGVRDSCDEATRLAIYRTVHASSSAGYRLERHRSVGGDVRTLVDEAVRLRPGLAAADRLLLLSTFDAAARRGAADIALLRDGDRAVAASLSFVTGGDLENRFAAVARTARPDAGTRLFVELFRDGIARGDRRFVYAADDGHPASGWGRMIARRSFVQAEAGSGPLVGIRRAGRTLRRIAAGMN